MLCDMPLCGWLYLYLFVYRSPFTQIKGPLDDTKQRGLARSRGAGTKQRRGGRHGASWCGLLAELARNRGGGGMVWPIAGRLQNAGRREHPCHVGVPGYE